MYAAEQAVNELGGSNTQFRVYPNPAHQMLNVYLSETSLFDIRSSVFEIHDTQGNLIKQFKAPTGNTTYMLDVEKYASGTYVLSLVADLPGGQTGGAVVQSGQIIIEK
ncbi:MAG: T9SS type A sorting domain-containing protein [Flavobacteriales bacterium]|nr:T9SS type A sorting domain-containing protein [Flavobacteriales bacterium]